MLVNETKRSIRYPGICEVGKTALIPKHWSASRPHTMTPPPPVVITYCRWVPHPVLNTLLSITSQRRGWKVNSNEKNPPADHNRLSLHSCKREKECQDFLLWQIHASYVAMKEFTSSNVHEERVSPERSFGQVPAAIDEQEGVTSKTWLFSVTRIIDNQEKSRSPILSSTTTANTSDRGVSTWPGHGLSSA